MVQIRRFRARSVLPINEISRINNRGTDRELIKILTEADTGVGKRMWRRAYLMKFQKLEISTSPHTFVYS